jgi:hypothetical protein
VYVGRWALDVGMFRKNSKHQRVRARNGRVRGSGRASINGRARGAGAQVLKGACAEWARKYQRARGNGRAGTNRRVHGTGAHASTGASAERARKRQDHRMREVYLVAEVLRHCAQGGTGSAHSQPQPQNGTEHREHYNGRLLRSTALSKTRRATVGRATGGDGKGSVCAHIEVWLRRILRG